MTNNLCYRVQGGNALRGDVTIQGSKNAVLKLIAASALSMGETVLHNVPDFSDTRVMLSILEYLGAQTSFENGTVRVNAKNLQSKPIPGEYVGKLRSSIMFLGPLLARFGVVEMGYPGGDVIGKRPVTAHLSALTQMGVEDSSTEDVLHLQGTLKPSTVILPEFSVTATENAVLAAAMTSGETVIHMAACEPHVQAVCRMIRDMGADVDGIGTHTIKIRGAKPLRPVEFTVPPDYLEAGTMVIAALVTGGKVRIHNVEYPDLMSFLDVVRRMGGVWRFDEADRVLFVDGEISSLKAVEVRSNIFPGFPTDLVAPMGVAMTQASGVSRIFERLYEGRLAYLYELEKMGAHIEILNSHQALIIGPSPLRARTVASNDLRAGAAVVLAALCAEGESTITDIRWIQRGYVDFDDKLRSLGADIRRLELNGHA